MSTPLRDASTWNAFFDGLRSLDVRDFSDESSWYAEDTVASHDPPENRGERIAELEVAFEAGLRWERRQAATRRGGT